LEFGKGLAGPGPKEQCSSRALAGRGAAGHAPSASAPVRVPGAHFRPRPMPHAPTMSPPNRRTSPHSNCSDRAATVAPRASLSVQHRKDKIFPLFLSPSRHAAALLLALTSASRQAPCAPFLPEQKPVLNPPAANSRSCRRHPLPLSRAPPHLRPTRASSRSSHQRHDLLRNDASLYDHQTGSNNHHSGLAPPLSPSPSGPSSLSSVERLRLDGPLRPSSGAAFAATSFASAPRCSPTSPPAPSTA
jgi:hypothetical protein